VVQVDCRGWYMAMRVERYEAASRLEQRCAANFNVARTRREVPDCSSYARGDFSPQKALTRSMPKVESAGSMLDLPVPRACLRSRGNQAPRHDRCNRFGKTLEE